MINDLWFGPLPALELTAVQAAVREEREISSAVQELLPRLRDLVAPAPVDLVLIYDGTSGDSIVVTAGFVSDDSNTPGEARRVEVAAVDDGVAVTFDQPPASTADAWVRIDAQLQERGLCTAGVYRQWVTPAGPVTLQSGVRRIE